jgi:hypothetical protein
MCQYSRMLITSTGEYRTLNGRRAVVTSITPHKYTPGASVQGFIQDSRGLWSPRFWHQDGCEYCRYNHGFQTDVLAEFVSAVIPGELLEGEAKDETEVERAA